MALEPSVVAVLLLLVAFDVDSRCHCCVRYCIDRRDGADCDAVVAVIVDDSFVARSCTRKHRYQTWAVSGVEAVVEAAFALVDVVLAVRPLIRQTDRVRPKRPD